jgi:bacteriocin-like protein
MTHDESKKNADTDQQQAEKGGAPELTEQELAKVSGGVRGPDRDDDLEVERKR